jgi:hypothetical protein
MKEMFIIMATSAPKERLLEELISATTELHLAYKSKAGDEELKKKENKVLMFSQMFIIRIKTDGSLEKAFELISEV